MSEPEKLKEDAIETAIAVHRQHMKELEMLAESRRRWWENRLKDQRDGDG